MRIDSKAFLPADARQTTLAATAACIMGLALVIVCVTPGNDPATPITPSTRVETAFTAVHSPSVHGVFVRTAAAPPAPTLCSDPAAMFLNATCQTTWKRHAPRHHRAVTFVAGNAAAAPLTVAE
jgi:hypothetical protein